MPQEENKPSNKKLEIGISGKGEFPILLPLVGKMNEKHIDSILENQKIEAQGKIDVRKSKEFNKRFYVIIGVVCLCIIIFAYNMFRDNENIINSFNSLLSHLASLIIGGLAGYGINEVRRRKK